MNNQMLNQVEKTPFDTLLQEAPNLCKILSSPEQFTFDPATLDKKELSHTAYMFYLLTTQILPLIKQKINCSLEPVLREEFEPDYPYFKRLQEQYK